MAILPELTLLTAATIFFILSLSRNLDGNKVKNTAIFLGVVAFIASAISTRQETVTFFSSYSVDLYSQIFKLMIGFGICVVLIFGQNLKDIDEGVRPEYYMFLFLSGLGLMMLVSSIELISLFVSLELSSFALYLLVPMRSDSGGLKIQMEAAIKYILFGVVATGFMLFGMSYLFGLTGTTYLQDIIPVLDSMGPQPVVLFALLMVLVGFFFKLAVFPMHFWVPDIYQGASNETTGFIATVPKLGAVALMIRFMTIVPENSKFIINLFIILALASMFYGNLCALVQKDVKRMLGFSGIAHAGFIVLGLLTMDTIGYATAIYYICGYVVMNLACFLVLCSVSQKGENLAIEDLNGLHKRQPILAFILTVGLFALAGIPPFVGFMGKFMLLTAALRSGHLLLVILAAFNTAIAIYYYLSVVRAAYTSDPEERPAVSVDGLTGSIGVLLVILIIIMGALPSKILGYAEVAVKSLM